MWALVAATLSVVVGVASAHDTEPLGDVRIESIRLSDVDMDGFEIDVHVAATARTQATFEYIVIDQSTVDSITVNLPPIRGPIRLNAGQPVEGLSAFRARISYQELESLEGLRRIVRDGRARVRGDLRGRLSLNVVQKLALMTTGAWVVTHIDREVAVEFGGGAFGRAAALAALTLAEPIWAAGRSVRARTDAAMLERAQTALAESIVAVDTRYDLRLRDGETARLTHSAVGFLVEANTVLVPAEAVEPWSFDERTAEAVERRDVRVASRDVDTIVSPVGAGAAAPGFSLQQKQLRVVKTLAGTEDAMSPQTRRRFRLRLRGRDNNAALLGIVGWSGRGIDVSRDAPPATWRPATIVRLRRSANTITPSYWRTSVRWDGRRYEIRDPVDAGAFGSPVWTETGVVAMVQDEVSAAPIEELLNQLGRSLKRRP